MRFCLWLPLGSFSLASRPCLLYWKAAAGTRGGGKSLADGLKGASAAHGVGGGLKPEHMLVNTSTGEPMRPQPWLTPWL